ncbi:hypothetical protein HQQ94_07315 [Shewanella sp. VB17]|uniref:hypothetical protein n=1 Tax=Shewanella sp. VB17 TaxID=2739432 RepID=UPI001563D365|nr:hypothetical protein [Shewanella sp. VB17]NRD73051.1 hypothetical protein [Shewanella sp. VB17]
MIKKKFSVATIAAILHTSNVIAGVFTVEGAIVDEVLQRGDGAYFITLNKDITGSDCTYKNIIIVEGDHSHLNNVISLSTTALVAAKTVKVRVSGCIDGYNIYSKDTYGLFRIDR